MYHVVGSRDFCVFMSPCKKEQPRAHGQNQPPSHPPFHVISGLSNFRDIGGWPIYIPGSPDHYVRRGILYRGSDTTRLTEKGEQNLRDLGIKADFDLRSKQQIERTGGYKDIPGIERKWTPVFADEEYTEEAAQRRYNLYASDGTEVRDL